MWAGNDPTSRHTAPDTLTQAIEDVMAFGIRYGVPIRLVDVVGERYRCRDYHLSQIASIDEHQRDLSEKDTTMF